MKTKVKTLIILSIIFCISIYKINYTYATNENASGTCGTNITWLLNSDGLLTISGDGAMAGSDCPWAEYKDKVKTVKFNGNITKISRSAFDGNSNLEAITLPDTIETINSRAFAECTKLKNIVFSKNLREIGASVFYKCTSLTSVDLPEDIMYVRDYAFADCTSLKSVTIKNFYVLIGDKEETISETAQLYGYKYSNIFHYARKYGRTFTDLATNQTTTKTTTNQDFLNALPKTGLEALGPTSQGQRGIYQNQLTGYTTLFCYEKDKTNAKHKEIEAKVKEITANCKTETEKARAILEFVYMYIDYQAAMGAGANIDRVYSIWDQKRGSCEAYTLLTNYMLYLCGIPTATATNLTHAWSVAYCDGKWIHVDSTQLRFGENTSNMIQQITVAYDGLVYVIDAPEDGARITGIAKTKEEIDELTVFTIPTNSYAKGIYEDAFNKRLELRAKTGTVGAEYIKKYRTYTAIEGDTIIGSNEPIVIVNAGDVDGNTKITTKDAKMVLQHIVKKITLTDDEFIRADTDGNKKITTKDAKLILQYIVKKITKFPAEG